MPIPDKIVSIGENILFSIEDGMGKQKGAFFLNTINAFVFFSTYILIAHTQFPTGLALILRSSLSCLLLLLLSSVKKYSLQAEGRDLNKILLRSIFMTANQTILVWCGKMIQSSTAITINSMGPIFVLIMEYINYGKVVSHRSKVATCVAFLGVYLIVNRVDETEKEGSLLASILLLFSQLLWAIGVMQVRELSEKATSIMVSFYFALFMLITGTVVYIIEEHTLMMYWPIVIVGVGWTFSHNIFTLITMWANNIGSVTMLSYLGVIESFIFEIFYKGDPVSFQAIIGSIMTAIGLAIVVLQ